MESSIQIEERAAAWLAKRDGGDWTSADEETFSRWLNASTANRVAYLRLEAAWEAAGRLQVFAAGAQSPTEQQHRPFFDEPHLEAPQPAAAASASWARVHHPLRALAASVLIASAIGLTYYLWPSGPSYRTEIGAIAAVPMVDGSKITLNTDSEVRVAVSDTERHVELAQGEAFFDVANDPNRPFVVEAGSQRFVAVGTQFSVLRKGDANRLVVTEGRVRVESAGVGILRKSVPPTEVSAGGIARSGEGGVLVEEKPLAEAEVMLSWRSGYLVFKDTTLADAVAEFNRYNTDKIVIEDASVAGIRIGGNFRSTNVDAFVRLLEDGFPIRVERQDERIVLSQN